LWDKLRTKGSCAAGICCFLIPAHHQDPTIDRETFPSGEQPQISHTNGMSSMFGSNTFITGGTFTQVHGDAHYHGFRGTILLLKKISVMKLTYF
jgi:hypothetical protein